MLTGKILEKEMATNFSILAWKIPWTVEPGGLQSMGSQKSDMIYYLNHHHQGKYNTKKLMFWESVLTTEVSLWEGEW